MAPYNVQFNSVIILWNYDNIVCFLTYDQYYEMLYISMFSMR